MISMTKLKKIIFFKLLFLAVFVTHGSSYKTIDSAGIVITYYLTYQRDTLNPDSKFSEVMELFIGEKINFFVSYNSYQWREKRAGVAMQTSTKDDVIVINARNAPPSSLFMYRIFKNYPENKITVTDFASLEFFKYEEPLDQFEWFIHDEKTKILGYTVQKATTQYGGRKWEAWFTPDIPINEGPYKFAGLPGLILSINDTEGHYDFKFNSIRKEKEAVPIKIKEYKYIEVDRNVFIEVQRRDEFRQMLNANSNNSSKKSFNNFIELN